MGLPELLMLAADILQRLGVEYCVTGSVASMSYAEARLTNDVDIAVGLTPDMAVRLARCFPEPDFYVSEDAAREAARAGGQFNVLHPASGLKIDFMVAQPDAFNESRFERIRMVKPFGEMPIAFASPEDVILKKLEYFREGGSEKHLRDIDAIRRVQGEDLDEAYLDRWADRLGVRAEWDRVRGR
jgi:hypothetical protein